MSDNLYRPLQNGSQYDHLIPLRFCEATDLGTGTTAYSVDQMAAWTKKHFQQLEKVAPLLLQPTLQQTVATVHYWVYSHFQYKRDSTEQLLKSPACAWFSRAKGMDCKSFSIVCSSILLNLGIKHYIRRIKQPASKYPNDYTHVYLIVPVDQKTGKLTSGYYTLDATTIENKEPLFTEPKDLFMEAFPHTGLNGVARPGPGGLGISLGDIKNFSFGSVFSGMSCWGGSAYNASDVQTKIPGIVKKYEKIYNDVNIAVATKDMNKLSQAVAYAMAWPHACWNKWQNIFMGNNWNVCTDDSIHITQQIHVDFNNKVNTLLAAYIDKYFIKTLSGTAKVTACAYDVYPDEYAAMFFSDIGPDGCHTVDVYTYMVKPGITIVPKFEITPDLIASINNGTAAPPAPTFLQQLQNVAATFGTTAPPTGNSSNPGGNYTQDPAAGGVQTPGTGTPNNDDNKGIGLLGWTVIGTAVIGGAVLISKQMKKNGAK